MKDQVYEGTVKFFLVQNGYGFIVDDKGTEYFVHITGVKNKTPLHKGASVNFSVTTSKKGLKATDVVEVTK